MAESIDVVRMAKNHITCKKESKSVNQILVPSAPSKKRGGDISDILLPPKAQPLKKWALYGEREGLQGCPPKTYCKPHFVHKVIVLFGIQPTI